MQAVAGVDHQPDAISILRSLDDACEFGSLFFALGVGIGARVEFHDRRAGSHGRVELSHVRINEQ